MSKYFLIGIPNAGKTTLGWKVAEILQLPFFDTDSMAYEKIKDEFDSPLAMFRFSTMEHFHREQFNAILELAEIDGPGIVATGAEIALIPRCVTIMKSIGTIIHIQRDEEIVLETLRKSGERGVILVNQRSGEEIVMRDKAVQSYAEELSQYEILSDYVIENNGSEDEGVEKLIVLIKTLSGAAESRGNHAN